MQGAECQAASTASVHENNPRIFSATCVGATWQAVSQVVGRLACLSEKMISNNLAGMGIFPNILSSSATQSTKRSIDFGISLVMLGSQLGDLDIHRWTKDDARKRESKRNHGATWAAFGGKSLPLVSDPTALIVPQPCEHVHVANAMDGPFIRHCTHSLPALDSSTIY